MRRLFIAILAFTSMAAAIAVGSQFIAARGEAQAQNQSSSKELIKDPYREYIEDGPFRTKLNGQKIDLDHTSRFEWDFADAKVKPLSTGNTDLRNKLR